MDLRAFKFDSEHPDFGDFDLGGEPFEVREKLGGSDVSNALTYAVRVGTKEMVLKVTNPSSKNPDGDGVRILKEGMMLAELAMKYPYFPNVERLFRHGEGPFKLPAILMERLPGAQMETCHCAEGGIETDAHDLMPWDVFYIARLLLHILDKVHLNGLIYRDLKPENLIWRFRSEINGVYNDRAVYLGLIDFGISGGERKGIFEPENAVLGTAAYIDPHALYRNEESRTPRRDLYSLGVVLYELLMHKNLFSDREIRKKLEGKFVKVPKIPQINSLRFYIPPAFAEFIYRLLETEDLSRRFKDAYEALKWLDINVFPGQFDKPHENPRFRQLNGLLDAN